MPSGVRQQLHVKFDVGGGNGHDDDVDLDGTELSQHKTGPVANVSFADRHVVIRARIEQRWKHC